MLSQMGGKHIQHTVGQVWCINPDAILRLQETFKMRNQPWSIPTMLSNSSSQIPWSLWSLSNILQAQLSLRHSHPTGPLSSDPGSFFLLPRATFPTDTTVEQVCNCNRDSRLSCSWNGRVSLKFLERPHCLSNGEVRHRQPGEME